MLFIGLGTINWLIIASQLHHEWFKVHGSRLRVLLVSC